MANSESVAKRRLVNHDKPYVYATTDKIEAIIYSVKAFVYAIPDVKVDAFEPSFAVTTPTIFKSVAFSYTSSLFAFIS